MFLIVPSTEIAQMVSLTWTKGLLWNIFKQHLYPNYWSKFKIISQNYYESIAASTHTEKNALLRTIFPNS